MCLARMLAYYVICLVNMLAYYVIYLADMLDYYVICLARMLIYHVIRLADMLSYHVICLSYMLTYYVIYGCPKNYPHLIANNLFNIGRRVMKLVSFKRNILRILFQSYFFLFPHYLMPDT